MKKGVYAVPSVGNTKEYIGQKMFFHLLNLMILNTRNSELSDITLTTNVLQDALVGDLTHFVEGVNPNPSLSGCGRPTSQAVHITKLDFKC